MTKLKGRVLVLATRAFTDVRAAEAWLRAPNRQLHGKTPSDALESPEGAAIVERQLKWFAGPAANGETVRLL